jgi:predicted GNAT superfamily acetyltransferase
MASGEAAGAREQVKADEIVVRQCQGLDELRTCVALQKEVWGFSDADLIPLRMFVVTGKIGGQVIGAFRGDELAGFAMALPGIRAGRPYLHSLMLAVRKQYRNTGLGRRLKQFQREEALARGIELMEWTFDPLEIKNSWLNIERLGAVARRYNVNQYGITSSPLQGGLPSDRLVAEWWLRSERVERLLQPGKKPKFEVEKTISVPVQVYEWKASAATRARALEIQERNRDQFLQAFSQGLAVLGYKRDREGNGRFLLGRWEEMRQVVNHES